MAAYAYVHVVLRKAAVSCCYCIHSMMADQADVHVMQYHSNMHVELRISQGHPLVTAKPHTRHAPDMPHHIFDRRGACADAMHAWCNSMHRVYGAGVATQRLCS
jgi:hypothetical protein